MEEQKDRGGKREEGEKKREKKEKKKKENKVENSNSQREKYIIFKTGYF